MTTCKHLIEQVNEQARMVGELQTQNQQLQGAAASESMGSAPRIPSSLHTPTGVFGGSNQQLSRILKGTNEKYQKSQFAYFLRRITNS